MLLITINKDYPIYLNQFLTYFNQIENYLIDPLPINNHL